MRQSIFCLVISGAVIVCAALLFRVRTRVKPRAYLLPVVIALVLTVGALEGYARLKSRNSPLAPCDRILYLESLPEADQLRKDRAALTLAYYDYHLYAFAPQALQTINFTPYYSARATPASAPREKASTIVWMFGGSTLQNTETTDELSIANQVALRLNRTRSYAAVMNFGVGGFHSTLEVVKFEDLLRRVSQRERPPFVVFYDGFNDAATPYWSKAIDIPYNLTCKVEAVVTGDVDSLGLYCLSKKIEGWSAIWRQHIAPQVDQAFYAKTLASLPDPPTRLKSAVDAYLSNVRIARAVCREFHIQPVFILQPMIFMKRNPTPFEREMLKTLDGACVEFNEKWYAAVREAMRGSTDFFDLSHMLDESSHNNFYDYGHTGPYTGTRIGPAIADILLGLGKTTPQPS